MNRYALVIFDMDGTLTEEVLDFDAIRREVGLAAGVGILEHIQKLSGEQHARAWAILTRHEMAAADKCAVHDGASELLASLHDAGVHTALLTRNSAECANRILARHNLTLHHRSTRDDLPHKPHPDSILNIVRRFGVSIRQTLMVGDYLYDLQAAHAAGCDSALLCMRDGGKRPPFADMATYCIASLKELLPLVIVEKEKA